MIDAAGDTGAVQPEGRGREHAWVPIRRDRAITVNVQREKGTFTFVDRIGILIVSQEQLRPAPESKIAAALRLVAEIASCVQPQQLFKGHVGAFCHRFKFRHVSRVKIVETGQSLVLISRRIYGEASIDVGGEEDADRGIDPAR